MKLSKWEWCIDFNTSIGQQHASIRPIICASEKEAKKINRKMFPRGKVKKIRLIEKRV